MYRIRGRFGWPMATAAAALILVAACEEFTAEDLVRVQIQQAHAWPDTLDVAEIATLTVDVLDSEGRNIAGIEVDWQTTDSSIVQLSTVLPPEEGTIRDTLEARLSAVVATHAVGSTEIIAYVDRPGFERAELTFPIEVARIAWPDFVTVSAVDIVDVETGNADRALTGELSAEWQSSDPATLKVNRLESNPLQATVTGYASGTAEIVIAIEGDRIKPAGFRVPIVVSGMLITEAEPWPESINVTNIDTVEVEIRDADGNPMPGVTVTWRSSNEGVLTVDSLDVYSAVVTTSARGGAEVIATAGGAGFQPAEYREWISVRQKWSAVDLGFRHTCALSVDGTAYCWGRNLQGELGTGDFNRRLVPDRVATFLKYQEIRAGGVLRGSPQGEAAHTCGRFGGRVQCWGSYQQRQLGDGSGPCAWRDWPSECGQPVPVDADVIQDVQVISMDVGGRFTCAAGDTIDDSNFTHCWGELSESNMGSDPAAGGEHMCTYRHPRLFCIGDNRLGQLGKGTTSDTVLLPVRRSENQFLDARAGDGSDAEGAGGEHSCAARDGDVWCWGSNEYGQLGTTSANDDCGGTPCSVWATRVRGLGVNVDSIALGMWHTCAIASGDVYCWGAGNYGQLGDGSMQNSIVPVLVDGGHTFLSISAGGEHTCGVIEDGSLYCWGRNVLGQLGDGSTTDAGTPVRVSEPSG